MNGVILANSTPEGRKEGRKKVEEEEDKEEEEEVVITFLDCHCVCLSLYA